MLLQKLRFQLRLQLRILINVFVLFFAVGAMAQDTLPSALSFWQEGDAGQQLNLRGRVVNEAGDPVAGALIGLRQADGDTMYIERYSGVLMTDERGTFSLVTAVPGQYSSAKHIHVTVSHDDYAQRHTEILFKGDPNITLGAPGSIEVVLETITKDGRERSIGGVEILLQKP